MTDRRSTGAGTVTRGAVDTDTQFARITRGFASPEVGGPSTGAGRASMTASVLSAVNLLAAVWLVVSPGVLGYTGQSGTTWNDAAVGIAIGLFALCRVLAPLTTAMLSYVNLVLGAWMIVAPWLPGVRAGATAGVVWNEVITGIVVACLSLASAAAAARGTRVRPE